MLSPMHLLRLLLLLLQRIGTCRAGAALLCVLAGLPERDVCDEVAVKNRSAKSCGSTGALDEKYLLCQEYASCLRQGAAS